MAYGTPKKASTGGCMWIITPLKAPYLVLTTLVLYLCTNSDEPPEDETKKAICQKNVTDVKCRNFFVGSYQKKARSADKRVTGT